MTNLFDVLKPKDDNLALGTVGASVDTAGTKAAEKKAPKNIVAASANESPAAAAARERAEAAKAQIEMRKAAEAQRRAAEERKALEESARKHMSESNGKTAPASAAAEAAKSFELKPPIKRPFIKWRKRPSVSMRKISWNSSVPWSIRSCTATARITTSMFLFTVK